MEKEILKLPIWPYFSQEEISAVVNVLQSGKVNYWTGSQCKNFENEMADFIQVPYAISLANGTLALELALRALDIKPFDDVIVPSRTFIATASCVVACGANPICADIDPLTQNITAETIARAYTKKTKAIIVVHLAGLPCDMDPILEFAHSRNLKVIEDCAQSIGAKYKGRFVGSLGDVGAFSFCQDKIITTGGEGGMFVTKHYETWKKAWSYKDHGKNPDMVFSQGNVGFFRWLHESFGSNFRMTEMQAAIGRMQLKKLPNWLKIRKRNAEILRECFVNIKAVRLCDASLDVEHAYYKYYVFLRPEKLVLGWDRERILKELNSLGASSGTGSCGEIYLEKAFSKLQSKVQDRFSFAQELSATSLMFLVHPTLTEDDMKNYVQVIKRVFFECSF